MGIGLAVPDPEVCVKPLTWHGKGDIPCESVPDPRIEDSLRRHGYDWSDRFRPFASYMNELSQHALVLDGEVVVQTPAGRPTSLRI